MLWNESKGGFHKGDRVCDRSLDDTTCGSGRVVKVTTDRNGTIVYTVEWDDGRVLHPYHAFELERAR